MKDSQNKSSNSISSSADDVHLFKLDEKVMLTIKNHEQSYQTSSIAISPFRFHSGMSNKFITYESALEFIAIHCFQIHGKLSKQLARLYIPFCFVYDSKQMKFVSMKSISSQQFSNTFRRVEKTFSKFTSLSTV
jgi:hypothetical protein